MSAGMTGLPLASVVVMTFNRPKALRRCLASLTTQSLSPQSHEVVVVDVSTSPVDQVLEPFQHQLRLIHHHTTNGGVAANRNVGVEYPLRGPSPRAEDQQEIPRDLEKHNHDNEQEIGTRDNPGNVFAGPYFLPSRQS